ncbi:MAG: hypothetical protein HWQ42_06250, partial [Nostoc sp. JL23]|nr:hypothetical protein [Nostoc sp. JL23]
MFTRTELEIKTIQELRDLCRRYGLKPTGNAGYKTSYVTSLIAFSAIALNQMQEGRGLRRLRDFQKINYSTNSNDNHFKGGMKGLPTAA